MRTTLAVLALLLAAACAQAASAAAPPVTATASFTSSDTLLDQIYTDAVATALDVVSPPVDLFAGGCRVPNELLILDGVVRDRCVYSGDLAVSGQTLLLAGADPAVVRNMILLFAGSQTPSGAIEPSACYCTDPLFDYSAYWVDTLYDYVLDTGDLGTLAAVWKNVLAVVDAWYPSVTDAGGLLCNPYGHMDYAYIPRTDCHVAYYNAEYVWALQLAAKLAQWSNHAADGARWTARAAAVGAATLDAFWDAGAGAFRDTPAGPIVHGEDDNAFAALAGIGSPAQDRSALAYLDVHSRYPYGNTLADNDTWDSPTWGIEASRRVYPFIGYFELLARFDLGLDASAFDLMRREWGYMVKNGPGTMWESIGPYGGPPTGGSLAHGWSTGVAPVLTEYVLGVQPTSPGFATFTVTPHVGDLSRASGTVPTPHGPIAVSWRMGRHGLVLHVTAPRGAVWTNPPAGH